MIAKRQAKKIELHDFLHSRGKKSNRLEAFGCETSETLRNSLFPWVLSCLSRVYPAFCAEAEQLAKTRARLAENMKSHQILAGMSPTLATDVLEFAFAEDKKLYRAALEAVAQARKVRTIFLERQPRTERNVSMLTFLSRPALDVVSDNLLRAWLLKKHTSLLTDFLDELKIPHEKGVVEDLPKTVDDAALSSTIDTLIAKHPAELVAVYLHAFNDMNDVKWENLDTKLHDDPRLKLKPAAA
jgi:hypothetical protein